jgi:hypothetical protein
LEWNNVAIFRGILEYLTALWNILWSFGKFFPFCEEKNLATLVSTSKLFEQNRFGRFHL